MSRSDSTGPVQSVRNAWINRLRDEALRMRLPAVCKVVQIGFVIATYADADGSNAYPSAVTIAAITGTSEDTVSRCMKVLLATKLVERRRRPNLNAVTQLVIPMGKVEWEKHLYLYTDNRQSKARREAKAKEIAEQLAKRAAEAAAVDGNPSGDGFRNPSPAGVPEPVPAGGSEPGISGRNEPGTRPRTGSEPVPGRVPEPVPGGGDQYLPTYGRHPDPDHNLAEPGPQPQVGAGAGARGQSDSSPVGQRLDDIAARIVAESAAPPHLLSLPGGGTPRASENGQRALLLSVSDDPTAPGPATRRVSDAEREQLRAAGDADITRVIAAIDELGEPAALALYSGRLVTRAHNSRALAATRTHTGT